MGSLEVRNSGAKCLVLAESADEVAQIGGLFGANPRCHVSITAAKDPNEIANFFWQPPKAGPNLKTEVRGRYSLSETERILIQRSFADCDLVEVCPPGTKGFSASVMVAYARMQTQVDAFETVPYLIKFDVSRKVWAEHEKYQTYIRHHVPFYLRPVLETERCHWDGEKGILVASFVEKTSSLVAAIERGNGLSALHGLLEETVQRWWGYSQRYQQSPLPDLVERKLTKDFAARAQNAFEAALTIDGSSRPPAQLLSNLQGIEISSYRRGVIHGDLHAGNVLVRGSDAILIDFPDCDHGPQLYDLATLELSIWLSAAPQADDPPGDLVEWRELSSRLYGKKAFTLELNKRDDSKAFSKQWNCIRYLRRFARVERDNVSLEYFAVTAVAALRRSMFGADARDKMLSVESYLIANALIA